MDTALRFALDDHADKTLVFEGKGGGKQLHLKERGLEPCELENYFVIPEGITKMAFQKGVDGTKELRRIRICTLRFTIPCFMLSFLLQCV